MMEWIASLSRWPGAFWLAFGILLSAAASSYFLGSFALCWALLGLYAGANVARAVQGLP